MENNDILNAFVDGANTEQNTEKNTENTENAKLTFAEVSEKCKECADTLGNYLLDVDNALSSQKLNQIIKLRRMLLTFRAEN